MKEATFAFLSCNLLDAFYARSGLSILFVLTQSIHTVTYEKPYDCLLSANRKLKDGTIWRLAQDHTDGKYTDGPHTKGKMLSVFLKLKPQRLKEASLVKRGEDVLGRLREQQVQSSCAERRSCCLRSRPGTTAAGAESAGLEGRVTGSVGRNLDLIRRPHSKDLWSLAKS